MKKILCALLAGWLVLPECLVADENSVVVPPVPSSGNVTLPLDEYNRLLQLANQPVRRTETPPVPYAIKRADLRLHVAAESVEGQISTVKINALVTKKQSEGRCRS